MPPILRHLAARRRFALAKSVAEMAEEKGEQVLGPDGEVNPDTIINIGPGEMSHPKALPRESKR